MGKVVARVSAGIESLDSIIDGLRTGDNVVWQVQNIDDYRYFITPFVRRALLDKRKVVYMHFTRHRPLIAPEEGIKTYDLDAHSGFEAFSTQVYTIIGEEGEDVFYVFDSLSELLSAWATDLMVGNFFRIVCPYLYQLNTVAYFALIHNRHSFKTVARIRETTQVLIDVYDVESELYIHPLKVMGRHLPTMFLPHKLAGDQCIPITSSVDMGRLFTHISRRETEEARRNLDYWDRMFLSVEDLLRGPQEPLDGQRILRHLCEILIGREPRIMDLAVRFFSLKDLLGIKARLIGTGYIGGKAVGMLLARKILTSDGRHDWGALLEPHDSFFIGSDVFYTYLVENGLWKLRMEQRKPEGYFEAARVMRESMHEGAFPEEIEEQFWRVIEYFGQSPIIVRSSSLLEDAFGNAFAGKYESIFCVNQGTPEQRFKRFRDSVRQVFASVLNEDALSYRKQRGLDRLDEQMALLVQRVSGSYRGDLFYPDMAGVGISYNPFAWRRDMDPKAGMLRLVMGLGTRAVNRVDNDYPRIVALDAPLVKPYSEIGDVRRYSQHEVDVLDITRNSLETVAVGDVAQSGTLPNLDWMGMEDREAEQEREARGIEGDKHWIITFDKLLMETELTSVMRAMLKTIEESYAYPVDIEFTLNFTGPGTYVINLVQCRPLQTKGEGQRVIIPDDIPAEKILFRSQGGFMGGSVAQPIGLIVYVDPEKYHDLSLSEKYDIARLIGKINRQITDRTKDPTLLIGPGRWGTTTPSLGVPVRFAEINHCAALVELAHAGGNLMPELSFGTHFFLDLVETDIFYTAIFQGNAFKRELLQQGENLLASLLPEQARYAAVVMVKKRELGQVYLCSDIVSQQVLCFST